MRFGSAPPAEVLKEASVRLAELDERMGQLTRELSGPVTSSDFHKRFLHDNGAEDGISVYVREHGWLTDWSDNNPDFINLPPDSLTDRRLLRLPNGWYYLRTAATGDRTVFVLLEVRTAFAYENQYLRNTFNPILGIPESATEVQTAGAELTGPDGRSWFRLEWNTQDTSGPVQRTATLLALLFATIAFWWRAVQLRLLPAILLTLLPWALRLIMITTHWPAALYTAELFSPRYYASSVLFNSLGDFLLNAFMAVGTAFVVYRRVQKAVHIRPVTVIACLFTAVTVLLSMHDLLHGLVLNSRISFNVSDLSSLDRYTLLAGVSVVVWLTALMLVLAALAKMSLPVRYTDTLGFVVLLALSGYTAVAFQKFNREKELETRKLLAQKIDARQDHVAEYLLQEQLLSIPRDQQLKKLLDLQFNRAEAIKTHIATTNLTGYLSKFELSVRLFRSDGVQLDSVDTRTLDEFRRAAVDLGRPTIAPDLYYLPNESGQLAYIGFVRLGSDTAATWLALTFDARFFPAGSGFPELFVSGTARESRWPEAYSLARYNRDALVFEYGSYSYAFTPGEFPTDSSDYTQVVRNGFEHLLYRPSTGTLIVVSRPAPRPIEVLTLFSWVFSFIGGFLAIAWMVYRLTSGQTASTGTLTRRIQVSVFSLVVLSFAAIGTGTVWYIQRKYADDQRKSIAEQVNGLWLLINDQPSVHSPLSGTSPLPFEPTLSRVAANTNIDYNLFDERGQLYYSSQPRIFDQGIVSTRMNPEAFLELQEERRTQFIHRESVGRLRYVAAYAPFTDERGNITGYLHLPYFEKQNELNQEISGFISALLNIYVLLFAIALLFTLLISARITQPLSVLQEKLAGIRLGRRNEEIAYAGTDEIGALVNEYNRLVAELAISADKLARSERESAWREMARQVAHEIKNPLTPMKLSVQHLQRTVSDGTTDAAQVRRVTETLLQQIETLSNIAGAFSDFARMPAAQRVVLDLRNVLRPTVDLFRDSPGLRIDYSEPAQACFVLADKDQLSRVFQNLLKNAVQAIPDERAGLIEVKLEAKDSGWEVSVTDNGIGIPESQRERIFVPNFTTKSGGTGLGLAMVYNIVTQSDGRVGYESTENLGTRFHVWLPEARTETVS